MKVIQSLGGSSLGGRRNAHTFHEFIAMMLGPKYHRLRALASQQGAHSHETGVTGHDYNRFASRPTSGAWRPCCLRRDSSAIVISGHRHVCHQLPLGIQNAFCVSNAASQADEAERSQISCRIDRNLDSVQYSI